MGTDAIIRERAFRTYSGWLVVANLGSCLHASVVTAKCGSKKGTARSFPPVGALLLQPTGDLSRKEFNLCIQISFSRLASAY